MAKRVLVAPQAKDGLKLTELGGDAPLPPVEGDSPEHRRRIQRAENRMRLITIADQIAGETLYTRSYKWDVGNKHFPQDVDAHMRFVTKYYPYTATDNPKKPGPPLYVDEPQNEHQVLECYAKQKILHKSGLRHIVIEPHRVNPATGKILEASTLDDCFQQLEDVKEIKKGKA
jgi:hypothetical protein